MSRRSDGYERLLDDTAAEPSIPAARPTTTVVPLARGQSLATSDSGKLGSRGVYAITASVGQPSTPQAPSTGVQSVVQEGAGQLGNLEDAPNAVAAWEETQNLLTIWLGMAIGTFILSFLESLPGTVAAIAGIVGSNAHIFKCFQGRDFISSIKLTYACSLFTMALSVLVCLSTLGYAMQLSQYCDGEDSCAGLVELIFFQCLWFALYGGLAALVYRKANHVWKLLDPVSSGMVSV